MRVKELTVTVKLDLELEVEDDDVWTEVQLPEENIDKHSINFTVRNP